MSIAAVFAGAVGGIVSWFAADFIGRPLRAFFQLRSEIIQCMLTYDNVSAPINERGKPSEDFTEDDLARLKEAQVALRQLAMKMQSFAATEALAARLLAFRYDPMKAGQSLVGYSNRIAIYGTERWEHRNEVLAALKIEGLS
jgi:hypothetical protein